MSVKQKIADLELELRGIIDKIESIEYNFESINERLEEIDEKLKELQ